MRAEMLWRWSANVAAAAAAAEKIDVISHDEVVGFAESGCGIVPGASKAAAGCGGRSPA